MSDRLSNDLRFLQQSLNLRAERQGILASNIANADTPNYKARDFDFSQALKGAMGDRMRLPDTHLALTSQRHIPAQAAAAASADLLYRQPHQPSMDGNTVDMDAERMQFADNTMRYQSSIAVISSRIKTMAAAIQE